MFGNTAERIEEDFSMGRSKIEDAETELGRRQEDFDSFCWRHIGPRPEQLDEMLKTVGAESLDDLSARTVPQSIAFDKPLGIGSALSEHDALALLKTIASKNQIFRSYIGLGYYDCITPGVVRRNILENPGWYTQYTPYQAEIAQGRLEALLNFQTMVCDLTGMELANSSLLDEGTAAAEALTMCYRVGGSETKNKFYVSQEVHPQTIEVLKTRAEPLDIELVLGSARTATLDASYFGAIVQYPTTDGAINNYAEFCKLAADNDALVVVASDLMSLALLTPPGEWGADVVVGNSQRFGVPLGFGGPHAAFFATREKFRRELPGRVVGVSKDVDGNSALRLALQTREQHIKRDRATSNICTAQVLLAVMASMYGVYHGPKGIRKIATRIHTYTAILAAGLERLGFSLKHKHFFDTVRVEVSNEDAAAVVDRAKALGINYRAFEDGSLGVALDETVTMSDLEDVLRSFAGADKLPFSVDDLHGEVSSRIDKQYLRTSEYMQHPVFNTYQSETEMLRYMRRLESKDLSLTTSMIPLGSCTMKLNATAELTPVTWPELNQIHPFAPLEQAQGYHEMITGLEDMLAKTTGFAAVSLQPNAGSQGEYAGLLVMRAYHHANGQTNRDVCLIPTSAHGTNPASAVMAGMKVVAVKCDANGNVDIADLRAKAEQHSSELAGLMVTYPSTHGVFEEGIREITEIVHQHGGQVYMDGANMNAQVGLCRPGDFGVDVCHLNLHKTFCIPHGGGGPGIGPIAVAEHLAPFLPGHIHGEPGGNKPIGPVSAAPWGSASILPISWIYIVMMGDEGLKLATQFAILNANYVAAKLEEHFPVLYRGSNGFIAHECILDLRNFKRAIGVEVADVAKRLMDYGFHAPTVSFPVIETLMVEPTESESKEELDRFCDAMIQIRKEIKQIEDGQSDKQDNVLKNAPHTAGMVSADTWERPYTRTEAAYPAPSTREHKYWPPVRRIDNAFGDRNLFCSCIPVEGFEKS